MYFLFFISIVAISFEMICKIMSYIEGASTFPMNRI